jgi:UDP-glucose 4-epimerase
VTIPTNPYGYTKLRIEELIKLESEESGLSAISLRYFNVAGAKKIKSGWLVENHLPETHLIPNVLKSSIENPVSVFGTDWPTTDGTCIRDYVHVVDLIEAHLKALDTLVSPGHEIFNLGSGCGFSVRDVLSAAGEVLGYAIPFNEAPRRDGDPAILVADVTKARDILNWTPKKDLNDMVSDTFLASNT